ncbi:GreA/GreB family elongation factor [Patescibacteria group bacterium]|nr:GreA/GreB family elongation factor [Patescibacteria group bacterium]
MVENKFYLTKEGLKKIEKEYQKLLEFKKLKAKGEVPAIWHSEDVNSEYLVFQEDMSLLEAKLAEYKDILRNVEIIRPPAKKEQKEVALGAIVKLALDGEIDEFQIVGTMEADPAERKISNESPLGQGLIGAKVGESVVVKASVVNHTCKILRIRYS